MNEVSVADSEDQESDYHSWMPFDLLVMAMFNGTIQPGCVGPVVPGFETLTNKMHLVQHTDPIETSDGSWTITLWRRKTKKELLKWEAYMSGDIGPEQDQSETKHLQLKEKWETFAKTEDQSNSSVTKD